MESTAAGYETMTFEKVRSLISAEHAVIKAELATLSEASARVLAGDTSAVLGMREALWTVYIRLVDHLAMEENHLLPLLETIDSWGHYRVENLLEDHRQQRIVLDAIMDECECGTKDDEELADDARWLVDSLLRDIEAEEQALNRMESAELETCGQ